MDNELEEMLEDKRRKLIKAKNYIFRMPNNKQKVLLLDAYRALLQFYCYGDEHISEDVREKIDIEFGTEKYERYCYNDTANSINEIEKNSSLLYDKYQQIINLYKDNGFYLNLPICAMKVDGHKMEKAVWRFFKTLGDDVLNMYSNMVIEGNVILTSHDLEDYLGFAFQSDPIDNSSVVLLDSPNYLEYYFTIVHEVGHCYQFYLQRNQREYSSINPYAEITSTLFELLFSEYLKNNYLIKYEYNKLMMNNHVALFRYTSMSKAICDMFKKDDFKVINPYNLTYSIKTPIQEVIDTINNECSNLPPSENGPDLKIIGYSIGKIIAMSFFNKLKNNFDEEWKNYKNYICTLNYLPMSDVIEETFDIKNIEDNIKNYVKSYH